MINEAQRRNVSTLNNNKLDSIFPPHVKNTSNHSLMATLRRHTSFFVFSKSQCYNDTGLCRWWLSAISVGFVQQSNPAPNEHWAAAHYRYSCSTSLLNTSNNTLSAYNCSVSRSLSCITSSLAACQMLSIKHRRGHAPPDSWDKKRGISLWYFPKDAFSLFYLMMQKSSVQYSPSFWHAQLNHWITTSADEHFFSRSFSTKFKM